MSESNLGKGKARSTSTGSSEDELLFSGRWNKPVKTLVAQPKPKPAKIQSTGSNFQLPPPLPPTSPEPIETDKKKQTKTPAAQPKTTAQLTEPIAQFPLPMSPFPGSTRGVMNDLTRSHHTYMLKMNDFFAGYRPVAQQLVSSKALPGTTTKPQVTASISIFAPAHSDEFQNAARTPRWFEMRSAYTNQTAPALPSPWDLEGASGKLLYDGLRQYVVAANAEEKPAPVVAAPIGVEPSVIKDSASSIPPWRRDRTEQPLKQAHQTRGNTVADKTEGSTRWSQDPRGAGLMTMDRWRSRSTAAPFTTVAPLTAGFMGDRRSRVPATRTGLMGDWRSRPAVTPPATGFLAPAARRTPDTSGQALTMLPPGQSDAQALIVAERIKEYRKEHNIARGSIFTAMEKVDAVICGNLQREPATDDLIPVSASTAVYVVGLPAGTNYTNLLAGIHCGQIWHTFIDPASPPEQMMAAAKVSFCTRAQAEQFVEEVMSGQYEVLGQTVRFCKWDRRCEPERRFIAETRCLQITGPSEIMDWEWFGKELTSRIELKITYRAEVPCDDPAKKAFQIHFAGIYAQSRAVAKALQKEWRGLFEIEYLRDPCTENHSQ